MHIVLKTECCVYLTLKAENKHINYAWYTVLINNTNLRINPIVYVICRHFFLSCKRIQPTPHRAQDLLTEVWQRRKRQK